MTDRSVIGSDRPPEGELWGRRNKEVGFHFLLQGGDRERRG